MSRAVAATGRGQAHRDQVIGQIRARLESDFARLSAEVLDAHNELGGWLGDGDPTSAAGRLGRRGARGPGSRREEERAGDAAALLQQTALALARLEVGSYGTCPGCGALIGLARLEAAPTDTTCVPCRDRLAHRR